MRFYTFTRPLFLFFLLLPACFFAGEGWNYIKNNDNKTARNFFIETLKKDSVNADALKGMIYLSEIEQDKLAYKKYVNVFLRNHPNEYFFAAFENMFTGKDDIILKQKNFSQRAKMKYKFVAAEKLKEKRQFEQSSKAYADLIGDLNWSLIGPFKNISGSGLAVIYPVEKESYDPKKEYINNANIALSWLSPPNYNKNGVVNFSDHLADGGTYYANTFIDVPADMAVQLRIARSWPMKIWMDDSLIFNEKKELAFDWDNEIAELNLKKGTHRLLVKIAEAPRASKSYSFLEFYDTHSEFNPGSSNENWLENLLDLSGSETGNAGEKSFSIRITDATGELVKSIKPVPPGEYAHTSHTVSTLKYPAWEYFKKQINDQPDDLFNYYALCKLSLLSGLAKQTEPLFVSYNRKNKSSVMIKYLTAKIYARNGKVEKTYDVLNEIEQERTPIFGWLYEKFKDIDMNTDEQRYLETLNKLKSITPSNYTLINAYLEYFDKKGMPQQREDFIKDMMKKYPEYNESLEYELNKNKKDNYRLSNRDRDRGNKDVVNIIRSRFQTYDYSTAIFYYKNKNNSKKVIQLYDELLSVVPYMNYYREQKAEFLLSEAKHEEALKVVKQAIANAPYNNSLYELAGDIYADKSKGNALYSDSIALTWYLKAKHFGRSDHSVNEKINKIQGQKNYKKLFTTKTFDEVLNESEWKVKYANEESVVLLYTRDLIMDSTAHAEVYQQLMIKILNESGAKRWTEYDFSFMGNINTLRVIKPNGTELTPDKQGGYVVIKNLEPGDLIQIDGVHEWQQEGELDRAFYMIHYVSFEAPIYYHKFELGLPKGEHLSCIYHKLPENLKRTTRNGFDFYKWEFHNISKVESEDATPDVYDLYSNMMVSTMPDWEKVNDWYQQTTYGKMDITYEVKEALDSILKPGMNDEEKVESIYNYLTKQIKYSYVPFLQSGYVPKEPGLTLSSRIGDCKDVATLMIVMLREAGIEANYTLVKTNAFNHQAILPSLYFDHVIAQYKLKTGKTGFLDMTTDFYPHYVLTENDVNAFGLNIKEGEKYIFNLPNDDLDSTKNTREYSIEAVLNTDKTLDLKIDGTYPGIAGGNVREYSTVITEQEQKNSITGRLGKGVFNDVTLLDYKFDNLLEISKPLKAHYKLKITDFSDGVANLFICRIPYIWAVQNSSSVLSKERHNRLDVEKLGNVEPAIQKINLTFPKGYKLLEVPADINYSTRFGTYQVRFKKTANGLYIEKYQGFKTKIVEIKDFSEFKAFYLKLLNLDKLKIAVQKM